MLARFYAFLNTRVFPLIIVYATHPLHITFLLLLGVVKINVVT